MLSAPLLFPLFPWLLPSLVGAEPKPVLAGANETLDHFGVNKVAVEGIQFVKPLASFYSFKSDVRKASISGKLPRISPPPNWVVWKLMYA